MADAALLRNLDLLIPQDPDASATDTWAWATVTSQAPLKVRLDGESAPLVITPEMLGDVPPVGARVWLQFSGRRVVAHGTAAPIVGGVPSGGSFPSGANMNTYTQSGTWLADTAAIANSLVNWPVEAIPRTGNADANNTVGSFRVAPLGALTVTALGTQVVQSATLHLVLPGGGRITVEFQRFKAADGVWTAWASDRTTFGTTENITGGPDEVYLGQNTAPSRVAPVTVVRNDFLVPYEVHTIDGVQWYLPSTTPGQNSIRQGTPAWITLTLNSPWANYGTGYETQRVIRLASGWIMFEGLIAGGSPGSLIATLPMGYRPPHLVTSHAYSQGYNAQINVYPDGRMVYSASMNAGTTSHISLANIRYPAADVAPYSAWTKVTPSAPVWADDSIQNGGANADTPGRPTLAYWQDRYGRVAWRGIVVRATGQSVPGADSPFTPVLPVGVGDTQYQIHYVGGPASSTLFCSLHLATDRRLYWKTVAGTSDWFSVANVVLLPRTYFADANWSAQTVASWANYGVGSWPIASAFRVGDGMYEQRGLMSGPSGANMINGNGVGDRRANSTAIFGVNMANAVGRADLFTDAHIQHISGSNTWASLDGIHYFVEA